MAEVLCPLIPSNSPLAAGQQARPSTPDQYTRAASGHQSQAHSRFVQMPRNNHYGGTGYRGTAAAPTYAFKATPNLQNQSKGATQQQQHSAPPAQSLANDTSAANRQRYPAAPSVSTTSSSTTSSNPSSTPSSNATNISTWSSLFNKGDSTFSSNFEVAPFTTENSTKETPKAETIPEHASDAFPPLNQTQALTDPAPKPTPGRYRRGGIKRAESNATNPEMQSTTAHATMGQFQHTPQNNVPTAKPTTELPAPDFGSQDLGADVVALDRTNSIEPQASSGAEQNNVKQGIASLSRYRRRSSVNTLDGAGKGQAAEKTAPASPAAEWPSSPLRPPSANQNQRPSSPSRTPLSSRTDGSNGPARTFAEVARRTNSPSPLSRPMTPDHASRRPNPSSPPAGPTTAQSQAFQSSPAVAAMAALSEKENQKGVKSKLRRAFSFGSSAELNRPTRDTAEAAKNRAQARREQFSSELDEEQATIARQQEAAGLGESIYSGQAGFVGSTDNLSISSTASSASMMLRKMGKGVKKGSKSIKGLFRPKSAIGVAPPDGPLGAGVGEVSRVTVEAEREKVNVNVDPKDQSGGGTGFPKLERNSVDAVRAANVDEQLQKPGQVDGMQDTRRSIVGGDADRAEVLASVKRSILKRSNTGSPTGSPTLRPADAAFTSHDNSSLERRASPVLSVPGNDLKNGTPREGSGAMYNQDYFGKMSKLGNQSSRSLPGTPRSTGSRNISFSPRIMFHDVWSSTEYDRRGDIATCNRLTPMLAQQIKEELNTFKMEMEVHEASKPHTHFF